jgi:hypothetical protein
VLDGIRISKEEIFAEILEITLCRAESSLVTSDISDVRGVSDIVDVSRDELIELFGAVAMEISPIFIKVAGMTFIWMDDVGVPIGVVRYGTIQDGAIPISV